MFASVDSWLVK